MHCTPGGEDRLEDSVLAQKKTSGFPRRWVVRILCKTRPIHSCYNAVKVALFSNVMHACELLSQSIPAFLRCSRD